MTICCPTTSSGSGPTIVDSEKYGSVLDAYGNCCALTPKPNSLMVHSTGGKPVKWADGSNGDRINLSNLYTNKGQAFKGVMGIDASGFLLNAQPDEAKGKQILTFEAGSAQFEKIGANRHCFDSSQIEEVTTSVQIAAFTTCGPDGQVCLVKLPSSQCGSLNSSGEFVETSPAGLMQMYAGTPSMVPEGWLLCDGRIVDSATYPALFQKIGYNFGKSGDNFYLPDMRGAFPRGVDSSGVRDPENTSRTELNPGGNVGENVGSYQADAFQCHEHIGGGVSATTANTTIGPGNAKSINYVSAVSSSGNTTGIVTSTCGTPRTASENRPKNVYVNFIISVGC